MENNHEDRIKNLENNYESIHGAVERAIKIMEDFIEAQKIQSNIIGKFGEITDKTINHIDIIFQFLKHLKQVQNIIFSVLFFFMGVVFKREISSLFNWIGSIGFNWWNHLSENWQIAFFTTLVSVVLGIFCVILGFWLGKNSSKNI